MTVFFLAWRNLRRQRTRTAAALATAAFGAAVLVFVGGYFADTFTQMRESYIRAHSGHLQIQLRHRERGGHINPYSHVMEDRAPAVELAKSVAPSADLEQRLSFPAVVSRESASVAGRVEGSDRAWCFDDETAYASKRLPRGLLILEGECLTDGEPDGALIGRPLARALGAQVGDPMTLMVTTIHGSLNAIDVVVRGIFSTSSKSFDERTVRVSLPAAQDLARTAGIDVVLLHLPDTRMTAEIGAALRTRLSADLAVLDWRELNDFYVKTEALFLRIYAVVGLVIGLVAAFAIVNVLNVALAERVIEIGTLRALGFRRRDIRRLFLSEGMILGILAGLFGSALGSAITHAVGVIGIWMPPPPGGTLMWISRPALVAPAVAAAVFVSLVSSGFASFWPAHRAAGLSPARALRGTV